MKTDGIINIELALGVGAVVLALRSLALFRAAAAVPDVHERLVAALENDSPTVGKLVRHLGFRSPYAEVAGGLIHASQRATPAKRQEELHQACLLAGRRVARRFGRAQALDLVGLALLVGLAAFAWDGLPKSLLLWALGGATALGLLAGLAARAQLRARIEASLDQLAQRLAAHSIQPARAPLRSKACPNCGDALRRAEATVTVGDSEFRADAMVCDSCGYAQTTSPGTPPLDAPSSPVN